ncbi:MAG: murein hydrolase activator EnvC family protein [Cyclobacteriaceae bacterium]
MTADKGLLIILLFSVLLFSAEAQQKNKAQLQKEKQQSLEKIKEVEKILTETSAKKKNTLGELNAINQRIRIQEELVKSIKEEINLLNKDIADNHGIVQALEEDLIKLKEEYARMLFAAQKANNSATRLTFLFSAHTFDQLIMRLRYMKQYGEKRKLQAEAITRVQEEIMGQTRQIEARRTEKNILLKDELNESNQLAELKKKQGIMVKALEKEEKTLKKDLEETRKAVARLDKMISDIIKEEMEKAAREARAKSSTNANVALSASFEENRRKFPWPVNGFVSQGFGRQYHPVLKGVMVDSEGLTIQTKGGEKVKTIFDGVVREVADLKMIGLTVLISHGEYYTVYAGLREVFVRRGDKVTTNQEIGEVLSNSEGISELRFQIRKNTTALDPQQWLRN